MKYIDSRIKNHNKDILSLKKNIAEYEEEIVFLDLLKSTYPDLNLYVDDFRPKGITTAHANLKWLKMDKNIKVKIDSSLHDTDLNFYKNIKINNYKIQLFYSADFCTTNWYTRTVYFFKRQKAVNNLLDEKTLKILKNKILKLSQTYKIDYTNSPKGFDLIKILG